MSRRGQMDVAIVGAGVVGATCALALRETRPGRRAGRRPRTAALVGGESRPARLRLRAGQRGVAAGMRRVGCGARRARAAVPAHARVGRGGRRRTCVRCGRPWSRAAGLDRREQPAGRSSVGSACLQQACTCIARRAWSRWNRTTTAYACAWTTASRVDARLAIAADGADSSLRELAGCRSPRTTMHSVAWWRSSKPKRRMKPRHGSASCRPGRSRSFRSSTAAARSCGPCRTARRNACWPWTTMHSTAN